MSDLTKIILTAVVSVIAKEFLTWLFKQVKSAKLTRDLRGRFRKMVQSHSLFLFTDTLLAAFNAWQLYVSTFSTQPITRAAVFMISFNTGFLFFWVREFFHDLRVYRDYRVRDDDENEDGAVADVPDAPEPAKAQPTLTAAQSVEAKALTGNRTDNAARSMRAKKGRTK